MKRSDLLTQEKSLNRFFIPIFSAITVTGFIYCALGAESSYLSQWSLLLHCIFGIPFSILVIIYSSIHFRRTIGFRRPLSLLIGILLFVSLLILAITGWFTTFFGSMEKLAYIDYLHLISAYASVTLLALHILIHIATRPEKRQKTSEPLIQSILARTSSVSALLLMVTIAIISLASFISSKADYSPERKPIVANYEYNYGEHPFRPSQSETVDNTFMTEREVGNSAECITCHKDIGKQWQSSIHSVTASDPTYVTNLNLLVSKQGMSATRYCEGCHTPLSLLTGSLSPGGTHGGIEGSAGFVEGVSCRSCHNIKKVEHLKGVASYQYGPERPYLFHFSDSAMGSWINRFMIRVAPEQHKADFGSEVVSNPTLCATCHIQFMDKDLNNWGWVKMQDEYSAWLDSPYSGQSKEGIHSGHCCRLYGLPHASYPLR